MSDYLYLFITLTTFLPQISSVVVINTTHLYKSNHLLLLIIIFGGITL